MQPLVVGHRGIHVGRPHAQPIADAELPLGAKVTCSSEQNQIFAPSMRGLPWSMPNAFSPQSATANCSETETTVARSESAGRNGSPSLS